MRHGWAIPTATDIAFAVGVLALLGRSIPSSIRVFLLALAIIDDIAAVLIIALFYSSGLDYSGLLLALLGVAVVIVFQRLGIASANRGGGLSHVQLYGAPASTNVPEPGTLALLGIGILSAGFARRRKRS